MTKQLFDINKLRCTSCNSSLQLNEAKDKAICSSCGSSFEVKNNKYMFVHVNEEVVSDGLDKIKFFVKKYHVFYNFLVEMISPVYPLANIHTRRIIRKKIAGKGLTAINLGSGYSNHSPYLYNVDLLPYPPVDITCDIGNLPFADNSLDYILNVAVLEHVPDPDLAISEMYRVLKPGGELYCFIPFIQGFHASPFDFQRFTKEGMKVRFKKFEIEKVIPTGPTSGFLWIAQEWFAMLLSFGIKPLHTLLHIFFMCTTWPLKFLDIIFDHHPMAHNIASGFSVIVKKPHS